MYTKPARTRAESEQVMFAYFNATGHMPTGCALDCFLDAYHAAGTHITLRDECQPSLPAPRFGGDGVRLDGGQALHARGGRRRRGGGAAARTATEATASVTLVVHLRRTDRGGETDRRRWPGGRLVCALPAALCDPLCSDPP